MVPLPGPRIFKPSQRTREGRGEKRREGEGEKGKGGEGRELKHAKVYLLLHTNPITGTP